MQTISIYDGVRLLRDIDANLVNPKFDNETVRLPAGTEGAVVHVHGPADAPLAFEIEFELVPLKRYALASVDAVDVELTSTASTR